MIPGSANPLLLRPAGGYTISRSLRFNSIDSGYLSKSFASAGDRKKWTWSLWIKRSNLTDTANGVWQWGPDGSNQFRLHLNSDGTCTIMDRVSATYTTNLTTTQVFRDPGAWFHLLIAWDTAQATASNRVSLFINGVKVTAFAGSPTYPSQDYASGNVNSASSSFIGRGDTTSLYYFSGYLADVHFVDAVVPVTTTRTVNGVTETILSDFGEFDATTGVWNPKAYTGTFTGNSFKLTFEDNSSNTATTLGKDTSGISPANNWTPNNLSVTAGAGNDSLVDVPTSSGTDSGLGGEVRGNYAVLNPLASKDGTLSNGNLDLSTSGSGYSTRLSTIGMTSGKWYFETTQTAASANQCAVGIATSQFTLDDPGSANSWAYYGRDGNKYTNGSSASYGATYGTNDVIGAAFDADNGTLTFYKNGISQGQAYSGLTSGPYFFIVGDTQQSATLSITVNFGQRPFAHTAPSGFKALCSSNLTAPLITKPSTVFNTVLWTGDSTNNRAITGVGFSPDLVWIKNRSSGLAWHVLFDEVRSAGNQLATNVTDAELASGSNVAGKVSAFNTDGFTLASGGGANPYLSTNQTSNSYVGWVWDAGTTTSTNTQGSITNAQVRANPTAGFSIVTYTGNGTSGATVGHGLGTTPGMFIIACRNTTNYWDTWHSGYYIAGSKNYMRLYSTAAAGYASDMFQTPTSTVVTLGTSSSMNGNGNNYVMYAFAPVVGYSSFGSYTGNGSSDGPFVFTNFRPRWILRKISSGGTNQWVLMDTARDTYNLTVNSLYPNLSNAEETTYNHIDILSNGFKMRTADTSVNGNGSTYIYAAFAESPFNYARAR